MNDAPRTATPTSILIVDDDDMVRSAISALLERAGHNTTPARNGQEAAELIRAADSGFDAVVSDINMPTLDGMGLLRAVREHDADLPVVLLTGDPQLETAMKAVEFGALRYLVKPFDGEALQSVVTDAVSLRRLAKVRRQVIDVLGAGTLPVRDPADLQLSLDRGIAALSMVFQPIVRWSERRVLGFEALVRTTEPSLPHPGALFAAAERLGGLEELGRTIRARVAEQIPNSPSDADIFVNLHTRDLLDPDLFAPSAPLSLFADRVVLEITERAPLHEISDVRDCISRLRDLGYRIALDDLGAGYAGLNSFAQLEPEIVKLDLALVRGIDREQIKQKLIRSMSDLCADMGKMVIAEGVETDPELEALISLGCDVFQGYLFARPAAEFAAAHMPDLEPVAASA